MRRPYGILVSLFLLVVGGFQAGNSYLSWRGSVTDWDRIAPNKSPEVYFCTAPTSVQHIRGPLHSVASKIRGSSDKEVKQPDNGTRLGLDLRHVDWDTVKAGKKGKGNTNGDNGNAKNRDDGEENGNGEKEHENGENGKNGQNGPDEKDEGGGWDRVWDAPKLG